MTQINLPFKVGQRVEARSFVNGYRGAWFRCKILEIITRNMELFYKLEYFDYPDEMIHQTKVFQKFRGEKDPYLMVRPAYPPLHHESELHKIKSDQEPLLVIYDSWQVGDLVDWWKDDCYWSGKILEIKKNETLQIELFPPPFGQGKQYAALCKDLRPSLEWSPENGWKVPSSKDKKKRQCAKLMKHKKEEDKVIVDVCKTGKEETERATEKLNIMESDEIEAAVLDLEELIVRIEWLKGMLRSDVGESAKSHWKYEDFCPSSKGM